MASYFLDDLALSIRDGCKLALPVDYAGVSMAMTGAILQSGVRYLDIVCVPTGGLQTDILIGAGRVRSVETSAITLGEAGGAPCFGRAVKTGTIQLRDATCPAIHAGLLAAQKGTPFQPIRGIIGSDLLRHRPDWKVIQNPFPTRLTRLFLFLRLALTWPFSTHRLHMCTAMSGSGGARSWPRWPMPQNARL